MMAPSQLVLNALRASLRTERTIATRATQCFRATRLYSNRALEPVAKANSPLRAIQRPTRTALQASSRSAQWRGYKTVQEAQSRYRVGPASPMAIFLFIGAGVGMYYYVLWEKERMERKRIAEHSKGIGKPKVGGPFELIDHHGRPFSSEKIKGKYSLIYFGFSHCPDICPEELDKMSAMLSLVENAVPANKPRNPDLVPLFVTCDPARDTPEVLKTYLKEFDERFIGLTGTWEQIKDMCKVYRVYFSTPPGVKPGMDYLVDHSIYFYLMDPDGDFVEAIGRQDTAEEAAKTISDHMKDWKGQISKEIV